MLTNLLVYLFLEKPAKFNACLWNAFELPFNLCPISHQLMESMSERNRHVKRLIKMYQPFAE